MSYDPISLYAILFSEIFLGALLITESDNIIVVYLPIVSIALVDKSSTLLTFCKRLFFVLPSHLISPFGRPPQTSQGLWEAVSGCGELFNVQVGA